jgi:hypothetical protein
MSEIQYYLTQEQLDRLGELVRSLPEPADMEDFELLIQQVRFQRFIASWSENSATQALTTDTSAGQTPAGKNFNHN